jgi:hypothetical protein
MRKENRWLKKCVACDGRGEQDYADGHGQFNVYICENCNGVGVVNSEELLELIDALRDNGFVVDKRFDSFGRN